jgi:hypothetical protein
MPRYIMKITDEKENKDYYLLWSSVVDAPVTYGMSLDEFKEFYKGEYGDDGMLGLNDRLERVEKTGTSAALYNSTDSFFEYNRAGENETCLDKEGILDKYCRCQDAQ